jgi:tetratricopeptide (TPR) repeat protein
MFSFEAIALGRVTKRARGLHAAGDVEGAREEFESFVRRHPKSSRGWMFLLWAVSEAGGTIEDRLDVLRRAVDAVPYDVVLIDAAIGHLMRAGLMIGDRRYLDEAVTVAEDFEELLGPSVESSLHRAVLAQLTGDERSAIALCEQVEEMLHHDPDLRARVKLGFCLASLPGHEVRGRRIAEEAARRLKDPAVYAYLAAIAELYEPERAEGFREEARRLAKGEPGVAAGIEGVLAQASEDIRLEREFLQNV